MNYNLEQFYIIDNAFLQVLKTATKSINIDNISVELFVIIFVATYFKGDIYTANIDLINNNHNNCNKMHENMIYKFLIKYNLFTEVNV